MGRWTPPPWAVITYASYITFTWLEILQLFSLLFEKGIIGNWVVSSEVKNISGFKTHVSSKNYKRYRPKVTSLRDNWSHTHRSRTAPINSETLDTTSLKIFKRFLPVPRSCSLYKTDLWFTKIKLDLTYIATWRDSDPWPSEDYIS